MATSDTWLGYPEPRDTDSIPRISPEEVVDFLSRQTASGERIQLIDVRRGDLTGAMITTSLNFPAHTFLPSAPTIAATLKDVDVCVLYCNSSRGRGPRCAGWLRDAILAQGNSTTQVKVLDGGAKAFLERFGEDETLVTRLPEQVKE